MAESRKTHAILAAYRGAAVLAVLMLLSACGDDAAVSERDAKAMKWLAAHARLNPPNRQWKLEKVWVNKNGKIVLNVQLPDKDQAKRISGLRLIEAAGVAKRGCPPKGIKFWDMLGKDRGVKIKLLAGKKTIASAMCRS